VDMAMPQEIRNPSDLIGHMRLTYDLMYLALQTDSTRAITLVVDDCGGMIPIPGVKEQHHALSHHGQEAGKLTQLRLIEVELLKAFGDFVSKLKNTSEDGETLLDRTAILCGSHLGDASGHDSRNLPIIVAGGRFKHGQYLAFNKDRNAPLCNILVAILHH